MQHRSQRCHESVRLSRHRHTSGFAPELIYMKPCNVVHTVKSAVLIFWLLISQCEIIKRLALQERGLHMDIFWSYCTRWRMWTFSQQTPQTLNCSHVQLLLKKGKTVLWQKHHRCVFTHQVIPTERVYSCPDSLFRRQLGVFMFLFIYLFLICSTCGLDLGRLKVLH